MSRTTVPVRAAASSAPRTTASMPSATASPRATCSSGPHRISTYRTPSAAFNWSRRLRWCPLERLDILHQGDWQVERARRASPGSRHGIGAILDEWIQRTGAYDLALQHLYAALVKSKGKVTVEVQSARREERDAFDQLPPDRRTILVIVSEVTRNGLTQAVIAIDEAHGRLDEALIDVVEASAPPR